MEAGWNSLQIQFNSRLWCWYLTFMFYYEGDRLIVVFSMLKMPHVCITCFLVVQEAVATGDPELLQLVLERRDFQRYSSRVGGIPELLQKLKEVSIEFYIWMHSPPKGVSINTVHIDRNNIITLEAFTILFNNKMNLVTSFKYNSLTLLLIHYWIIFAISTMSFAPLGVIYSGCFDKDIIDFHKVQMKGDWGKTWCVSACLKLSVFSIQNSLCLQS